MFHLNTICDCELRKMKKRRKPNTKYKNNFFYRKRVIATCTLIKWFGAQRRLICGLFSFIPLRCDVYLHVVPTTERKHMRERDGTSPRSVKRDKLYYDYCTPTGNFHMYTSLSTNNE